MTQNLTHVDEHGRAVMVDVSNKPIVRRRAVAEAFFVAASETLDRIMAGDLPKGEALAVARIAGIQAAKRVDAMIPLCHTLPLEHIDVSFDRAAPETIRIEATAVVTARTGVEMEALTAVNVAALTLWDMTKAIDKNLRIDQTRLVLKEKDSPVS
ncbi:MAG: cyclic pyranopterin monophosphate synthase MoaC [Phycisphaerales bacterium]|jgi:cyclic pyranopterin phosphate synthase|nr:cyclic pyranopterin monophosphate synthase MoaC [Phycisphaerales bacterium]